MEIRRVHLRLDQIGVARARLELPGMGQQFVGRRRQHRPTVLHQPSLRHQPRVDVEQPADRVPRQAIHPPSLHDACARGRREGRRVHPGVCQQPIHGLQKAPALVIGDDRLVHRHQVRRVAGRDLRRQLRIARPRNKVHLQPDVGVLCLEAVEQRRQDTAFAVGRRHIGAPRIGRPALPEKALHHDLGAVVGRCAARQKQQHGQPALHRAAAPAIACTICFWNRI